MTRQEIQHAIHSGNIKAAHNLSTQTLCAPPALRPPSAKMSSSRTFPYKSPYKAFQSLARPVNRAVVNTTQGLACRKCLTAFYREDSDNEDDLEEYADDPILTSLCVGLGARCPLIGILADMLRMRVRL
ncbi:hypothetical protein QBC35DRAFT_456626 [Podospora australis]|uniref:Uncharacterized protein n=1 Tax=Podospora australis TaxID=1536484 RepID=A0AAN6WMY4_9PEZI|nr:hypothetical protein QBC35DRAFT_456626 [Podospora australis]